MKRTKSTPSLRKRSRSRSRSRSKSTPSLRKRTKSAPSLRKRSKSRSRKKLNRTRSAPKRISTSKKKRSKKGLKPRMLTSIVPRSIPQLDWRVAHPDQYSKIYQRSIPAQNVKLVKKKGGSKKSRK